jgi:predicted transcriptional regulator
MLSISSTVLAETTSKPFNGEHSYRGRRSMAVLTKRQCLYHLPLRKKYRDNFEIIALMLELTRSSNQTRFSIMSQAKINCGQLKKYLRSLTEMGFLQTGIDRGHISYRTSEKGLEFLRQYYTLLGMLFKASGPGDLDSLFYDVKPTVKTVPA